MRGNDELESRLLEAGSERVARMLDDLRLLSYPGLVPLFISIFNLYNGEDGTEDLRILAIAAIGMAGGARANRFLLAAAQANRSNAVGDFAVDNLSSAYDNAMIEPVIQIFEDPVTCEATRLSALNTLASLVQGFRWEKPLAELDNDLRMRLELAASESFSHRNPSFRAFACRLARTLSAHRTLVERLAQADNEEYYGGETVADEARQCLEHWDGS